MFNLARSVAWLATGFTLLSLSCACAQKLETIHAFNGPPNDGGLPTARLVYANGFLYGSTRQGGSSNNGTVYQIDLATGVETVLYSFLGGKDGGVPANLMSSGAYVYGVTVSGGRTNNGTIFQINTSTGKERVLHAFKGGADGANPEGGLIAVGGTFYGTTAGGGTTGYGNVFGFDPKTEAISQIHEFSGNADGGLPIGPMIRVGNSLYGTTEVGGTGNGGTIFEVDLKTGAFSSLASINNATQGSSPTVLAYKGGQLYGAAFEGGATGYGSVFKVAIASGAISVLYNFTGRADGAYPESGVILEQGILYGTASAGGTGCNGTGCGVVYEVNAASGQEKVVYTFDDQTNGGVPYAPLTDVNGVFYGATSQGGAVPQGFGTVFSIQP